MYLQKRIIIGPSLSIKKVKKLITKVKSHLSGNFLGNKKSGASILLGVILVALIVTFALGITNIVIASIRQSNNVKQANIAYYAAEGALERGLLKNQQLGIGGSFQEETQKDKNGVKSQYEVKGQTNIYGNGQLNGKYIIPAPWTGNVTWHGAGALPQGGCDPAKYPSLVNANTQFEYAKASAPNGKLTVDTIEHPCNWGKIALGEKVTIPLFGYDLVNCANGVCQPINMKDFTVRLRTPCSNGEEYCLGSERAKLDCKNNGDAQIPSCTNLQQPNKGDVIALWQIEGKDPSNNEKNSTMVPNDVLVANSGNYGLTDTQLNEGKINNHLKDTNDFTVLAVSSNSSLLGKIDSQVISIPTMLNNYTTPSLKLSIVGNINECVDGNCTNNNQLYIKKIPYLEYQIQFDSSNTTPPSNVEQLISGQGTSGSFNQVINVKVPQDSSGLEYVLQE